MSNNIYDIMLNSTRMRIVQVLASHGKMSAKEIDEIILDVPRTTLYRHINILINANIIAVIEEKKIRGSMERTLALNIDEINRHNTMENIPQQAFRFLMNTYVKFEEYFSNQNRTQKSKIFFNNTVMMMNDEEFDEFLSELQTLLVKYHFDAAEGRKPRDISVISAPSLESKVIKDLSIEARKTSEDIKD